MNKEQQICYGCMTAIPKNAEYCPNCGFHLKTFSQNPRCLKPGTILADHYLVGNVIGEGGFGITYIGQNLSTKETVAIKEYFPTNIASRDCRKSDDNSIYFFDDEASSAYQSGFQKYVREAQTLKEFRDLDGIVSILDFFYANNTAYIIMEYIDGISLRDYLRTNGPLSPHDTFELMMPVMLALEKVHERGIIHRDISPDNIIIRMDGAFKLIDFGAARLKNDANGLGLTIILKRGFAPEEQYRTHGKQGPWTDVYALCATMYKTMTNVVPPESMERLINDELLPIQNFKIDISDSQAKALHKGLQVKAKDRFQSIYDLRIALTRQSQPVKSAPSAKQSWHMVATIQDASGTILRYRIYDTVNHVMSELTPAELTTSISTQTMEVENIIVYQHYIQPVGGGIRHYPILNANGDLLANNNLYFIEHSITNGYRFLNYKGEEFYFSDLKVKEYLYRHQIANEDKINLFITLRNEPETTRTQTTTTTASFTPDTAEPKAQKLSLRTNYAEPLTLATQKAKPKDASRQLRLKMAEENKFFKKREV